MRSTLRRHGRRCASSRPIARWCPATPHVAGVAAILRGRNAALTWTQARSKLDASVDDLGTPGRGQRFGFGRANLVKAAS
jgi:subtilisin family serine protease